MQIGMLLPKAVLSFSCTGRASIADLHGLSGVVSFPGCRISSMSIILGFGPLHCLCQD